MGSFTSEARTLFDIKREAHKPRFVAGRVIKQLDIIAVRQFCYRIYVERKEIEPHLIHKNGMLGRSRDPCATQSVHFAVKYRGSNDIVAASRLILTKPNQGVESLQLDVNDLSLNVRKRIEAIPARSIVEPASYAKQKGAPPVVTFYLLREMLHYSVDHHIGYWLIALNPHIESTYRRRFGPALERLGDYISSKVDLEGRRPVNVPYLLDVQNAISQLEKGNLRHRLFVAPLLHQFMRAKPEASVIHLSSARRKRRLPYQA